MDNNKNTLQTLHNRRKYLQRKLKGLYPFLRGSIVAYRSPCGKANWVVSRVVCKLSEVLHWPSLPILVNHLN